MFLKFTIIVIFLSSICFAAFEKVSIGNIDPYYSNKISKEQLKNIIHEIEYTFEKQLGANVFDYSENGKPIHLIYLPPSKLEKNLEYKTNKLKDIEKKIEDFKTSLPKEKIEINKLKNKLQEKNNSYNIKVKKFNNYIKNKNKKKSMTNDEYQKLKNYVNTKKSEFFREKKTLEKIQSQLKYYVKEFNKKVNFYNNQINSFNSISQEVESMSRGLKKIKGRTFGIEETKYRTYIKNGQKIKEKSVKKTMNKIEIYGFDNLSQLKAIIAHEIGHLIGLTHVHSRHSLMNPILQEKQVNHLYLTKDDIKNFHENY